MFTIVKLKKIFVVFKTHFDIGFTALPSEVKAKYSSQMIPNAVDTCVKSKERDSRHPYVWTMPSWPLTSVLRDNCEGLEDLINEKQILWHALPFTTHTEFCGLEEFIRGMYISEKLSSKFDFLPISAKMTDVPGHTWILPTLLNNAGVKFLHLGCNPCSTPPDVPPLFYWEGPDGSRVLTMYSKGDYGSGIFPEEDWDLPVWLAMFNTGDNLGAHNPEVIKDILDEVKGKSPDTEVHFGTLDDFYNALSEIDLKLPIVKKDLADSWIHGVGTYPKEVSEIRKLRNYLTAIETVISLKELNDEEFSGSNSELIENAYENMLLFGEHTWGLDTKIGLNPIGRVYDKEHLKRMQSEGKYDRMEESWKEKSDYVKNAVGFVSQLETNILEKFSDDEKNVHSSFIKVYNSLAIKRDGLIKIDRCLEGECSIFDEEKSEILSYIAMDNKLYVEVKDVEPLSFKVLKIIKEKYCQEMLAGIAYEKDNFVNLTNKYISLVVDKNFGTIVSLKNKATGKDWVDSNSQFGFGQYVYDIHSKKEVFEYVRDYAYDLQDWYLDDFGKPAYPKISHKTFRHCTQKVSFENTSTYGRIIIEQRASEESVEAYGNAKAIISKITLFKDKEYVEFEYEIVEKQETPYLESGHFVFPLAAEVPSYSINKIGSVIDPCKDILKDANHVLYCLENWVDICDKEEGLLFIPFDTPLLSIGKPGIERYSPDYAPQDPIMYFNAFNNQWGTNFPQWIGGNFELKYRIIPHTGNWQEVNAFRKSKEAVVPLISNFTVEAEISLKSKSNSLVLNELNSVEILALKASEDGEGFILRLREALGKEQKQKIIFDKKIAEVFKCNLLEVVQGEIKMEDCEEGKKLDLSVSPFEIITLKLKKKMAL